MEILAKYPFGLAWYARVRDDDGIVSEFKIRQREEPADDRFLALALKAQGVRRKVEGERGEYR